MKDGERDHSKVKRNLLAVTHALSTKRPDPRSVICPSFSRVSLCDPQVFITKSSTWTPAVATTGYSTRLSMARDCCHSLGVAIAFFSSSAKCKTKQQRSREGISDGRSLAFRFAAEDAAAAECKQRQKETKKFAATCLHIATAISLLLL